MQRRGEEVVKSVQVARGQQGLKPLGIQGELLPADRLERGGHAAQAIRDGDADGFLAQIEPRDRAVRRHNGQEIFDRVERRR